MLSFEHRKKPRRKGLKMFSQLTRHEQLVLIRELQSSVMRLQFTANSLSAFDTLKEIRELRDEVLTAQSVVEFITKANEI